MKKIINSTILTISIAIFSMFFGAGNVVFPLQIGIEHQGQCIWAFLGLLSTAIGGPLLGLLAATLLQGNCKRFFFSGGKPLGIMLMTTTLAMGPLIVLPRCLTVSYGALNSIFPTSLLVFAIIFSIVSLICCWKHRYVLPILGKVLSPLLLACLITIIYMCLSNGSPINPGASATFEAFTSGFLTGYYTMDLIASIFFSASIWALVNYTSDKKTTFRVVLTSGILGCIFLAVIYLGLTLSAACFRDQLINIAPENLLSHLALLALGPKLSILSNIAVGIACLTTVISFTMAISDIMCKDLFNHKISYHTTIVLNLIITCVMAQCGFSGLMVILHPMISVCYPIMILLVLKTISENLTGKKVLN